MNHVTTPTGSPPTTTRPTVSIHHDITPRVVTIDDNLRERFAARVARIGTIRRLIGGVR